MLQIFEKASHLQDSKNKITLLVFFYLGRTSFFVYKIDFCYVATSKWNISGVYWLLLVLIELLMPKNIQKSKLITES